MKFKKDQHSLRHSLGNWIKIHPWGMRIHNDKKPIITCGIYTDMTFVPTKDSGAQNTGIYVGIKLIKIDWTN